MARFRVLVLVGLKCAVISGARQGTGEERPQSVTRYRLQNTLDCIVGSNTTGAPASRNKQQGNPMVEEERREPNASQPHRISTWHVITSWPITGSRRCSVDSNQTVGVLSPSFSTFRRAEHHILSSNTTALARKSELPTAYLVSIGLRPNLKVTEDTRTIEIHIKHTHISRSAHTKP